MKILYALISLQLTLAYPELGKWTLQFTPTWPMQIISKSMYEGTIVNIDMASVCKDSKANYTVEWLMLDMQCYGYTLIDQAETLYCYNSDTQQLNPACGCNFARAQWKNGTGVIDCTDPTYKSSEVPGEPYTPDNNSICPKSAYANDAVSDVPSFTNRKRSYDVETADSHTQGKGHNVMQTLSTMSAVTLFSSEAAISTSWTDGPFSMYIVIKEQRQQWQRLPSNIHVTIVTRDTEGHLLSAVDLHKLYFYLTMTLIYVFYGFIWFLLMACYSRDLLRIQYFIGLVIILQFVEKVVFYSQYQHLDKFGVGITKSMLIMEVLLSCANRTLVQALTILICVGFGTIKPKLGCTLHKLIAVCFIYFILASTEGCLQAMQSIREAYVESVSDSKIINQFDLLVMIPLSLWTLGIMVWILRSLRLTIKTLHSISDNTRLSLYIRFGFLLLFNFLAAVAFLVWYFYKLRFSDCI